MSLPYGIIEIIILIMEINKPDRGVFKNFGQL